MLIPNNAINLLRGNCGYRHRDDYIQLRWLSKFSFPIHVGICTIDIYSPTSIYKIRNPNFIKGL